MLTAYTQHNSKKRGFILTVDTCRPRKSIPLQFLHNFYGAFFSQRVTELESTVLWCWGTQKIGHQKKSPWKFLPEAHPKVQICFQVKKFPDRNAEITLRFWVLLMFSRGALLIWLTQFPHDLRRFWSWNLGSRTFVVCSNRKSLARQSKKPKNSDFHLWNGNYYVWPSLKAPSANKQQLYVNRVSIFHASLTLKSGVRNWLRTPGKTKSKYAREQFVFYRSKKDS